MGNILGTTKMMTCGMEAKVIVDRGSKDIDIEFADGTVVKHKARATFLSGKIWNPSVDKSLMRKKSILGQTRVMNCGLKATVIADRGNDDIDVKFEDGEIVLNRYRCDFLRGNIASPKLGRTYATHKKRASNSSILGQKRQMGCGMYATVIEDKGSTCISVQFEDGTIVTGKTRSSFRTGEIRNPNYNPTSIVGKTVRMKNGLEATCIAYHNSNDVDIEFEDGIVVLHKSRTNFLEGRIAHPNVDPYNQIRRKIVGETKMMNCGMSCTVIVDRRAQDIDVQFEDGTIVEHKTRVSFFHGMIANPNVLTKSLPEQLIYYFVKECFPDAKRTYRPRWLKNPETNTNLEIDIWIPSLKIGIEYDGAAWHGEETSRSFVKANLIEKREQIRKLITVLERGAVIHHSPKHENYQLEHQSTQGEYVGLISELEVVIRKILESLGMKTHVEIDDTLIERVRATAHSDKDLEVLSAVKKGPEVLIGETREMNCRMRATIIAARTVNDIDVQFEDGTIVEHRTKYSFFSGSISNPKIGKYYGRTLEASILGETRKMNCGINATVVAFRSSEDIDIQFEDGVIVSSRTKNQFQLGNIAHPRLGSGYSRRKMSHLGETKVMKNGMKATIVEYKTFLNISVQFEDGTKVDRKSKNSFDRGEIRNPNIPNSRKTDITGKTRIMNCGMPATVISYKTANDIDVQFEDGTIVLHKSKDSFLKGAISNPNLRRKNDGPGKEMG